MSEGNGGSCSWLAFEFASMPMHTHALPDDADANDDDDDLTPANARARLRFLAWVGKLDERRTERDT